MTERHPRTMKIDNPPSPPFRKGGVGGFEIYFLSNFNFLLEDRYSRSQ